MTSVPRIQSLNSTFGSYGNPATLDQSTWKAIAITAAVIAGLVFLLTLLMIRRIKIAIACIKVGTVPSFLVPAFSMPPIHLPPVHTYVKKERLSIL